MGGWSNIDTLPKVNSACVARGCMKYAKEYCNIYKQNHPHDALTYAYSSVILDDTIDGGSSTVTIMNFDQEQNILHTTQLGDSSYAIIRDNKLFAFFTQNNEQLNNIPYRSILTAPKQLAKVPKRCKYIKPIQSTPEEAINRKHYLKENDIIILASDGLWDNIYDDDFIDVIDSFFKNNENNFIDVNDMAEHLVYYARYYNKKPDDITVIVSIITKK